MVQPTSNNPDQTVGRLELSRHAERRRQGIATVSVLTGPIGSAIEVYRRCASIQDQVVLVREATRSAIAIAWLDYIQRHFDLTEQLLECLDEGTGNGEAEFRLAIQNRNIDGVQRYIEYNLPVGNPPGKSWLCRLLLPYLALGTPPNRLLSAALDDGQRGRDLISSTALLLNDCVLPALILVAQSIPADVGWVVNAAETLVELALASPRLPVAIACDANSIKQYLMSGPESRARALIVQGLIQIDAFRELAIRDRLQEVQIAPTIDVRGAIHDLVVYGGSENSVELLAEAATEANLADCSDKTLDGARSAAERFLFDRLENHPATAGLFQLNKKVDGPNGGRSLEVDLCARTPGIAIEVDGYYHFQDADAYRRDRRKDFALQQSGYFVVRCLASDVVARFEEILGAIQEAIRIQQHRSATTKVSPQ